MMDANSWDTNNLGTTFIGYDEWLSSDVASTALALEKARTWYFRKKYNAQSNPDGWTCRLTLSGFNPELVVALVIPNRGTFYATKPDGAAIGWLQKNGRTVAPQHYKASKGKDKQEDEKEPGRGDGPNGIWHAEDLALYQFERLFPGESYPAGSSIAVFGRMQRTTWTPKGNEPLELNRQNLGRDLTPQERFALMPTVRSPCKEASRSMPEDKTCSDILENLHIQFVVNPGDNPTNPPGVGPGDQKPKARRLRPRL